MKVITTCNLKGKTRTWRKGTEIEEPFPPDIAEELKAVQEGRSDALKIVVEEISKMNDDEFEAELENHADGDIANALLETGALENIDRAILFRKFDRPVLNCYGCAPKQIEYQSTPWFFNQLGAKKKRQLLLRKFK